MTYSEKLALAAQLRAGTGLADGLPEFSRASVRATKMSAYLPGGEKKSKVPMKPPAGVDLSALNPANLKRRLKQSLTTSTAIKP